MKSAIAQIKAKENKVYNTRFFVLFPLLYFGSKMDLSFLFKVSRYENLRLIDIGCDWDAKPGKWELPPADFDEKAIRTTSMNCTARPWSKITFPQKNHPPHSPVEIERIVQNSRAVDVNMNIGTTG